MISNKKNNFQKNDNFIKIKKGNRIYRTFVLLFSVLIGIFALSINSLPFANNILKSIKMIVTSSAPFNELFDDTGKVKFVSTIFKETVPISSLPIDLDLHLDAFNEVSNTSNGIVFDEPQGIVYATLDGVVHLNKYNDIEEVSIIHEDGLESRFYGIFNVGIQDGQSIKKGEPLGIVLSNTMQFVLAYVGEPIKGLRYSDGAILWGE